MLSSYDLNANWVGAGHLKIGDSIKQADGTLGTIANVITLQQTQEMFNLTVSEAHTYYVGDQGWLVHNCDEWNWSGRAVSNAAKLITENLATKGKIVTVGSKTQAEELMLGMFTGYKNTTGLDGVAVKQLTGTKMGTYHWDTELEVATGRVMGHSGTNPHGSLPHVQVYTPEGGHITIEFPWPKK